MFLRMICFFILSSCLKIEVVDEDDTTSSRVEGKQFRILLKRSTTKEGQRSEQAEADVVFRDIAPRSSLFLVAQVPLATPVTTTRTDENDDIMTGTG